MSDELFLNRVADALATLPTVEAVALGGSRAQGTHRADSDWDLAIYYRGSFDPQDIRNLGWEGQASEIGDWGGGIFNGGAWLRVDGRNVDVHYRDLEVIEKEIVRAVSGQFDIERLMFHLAGIPTYLVVGEVAINRVLRGTLPHVDYPEELRRRAPRIWSERAELTLSYAETNHAHHARISQCAGHIAVAAVQYAHAILAAGGEWATNDKRILERAGLRRIDEILLALTPGTESLTRAIAQTRQLGNQLLGSAQAARPN